MRKITAEELKDILAKHKKWLYDEKGGERADLSETDLRSGYLANVNLQYADLSHVNLRHTYLSQVDLRNANLQGANLRHAYLYKARLQNANLHGADLYYANLTRAMLQESDLSNADLSYADLWQGDLSGANLQNTKLLKTILGDANVRHVKRQWLITADHIGSRKAETLYFADIDSVKCGCWHSYEGGTLDEFKARVDETYPADDEDEPYPQYRIEYLSAIKMFESMREAYLKKCNRGGKSSENNITERIERNP